MAAASILLVDDDAQLCLLMTEFLTQYSYELSWAHDGVVGLGQALEGHFDLLILDVMLPRLDGFELLRRIRQQTAVPIIMLTARAGEQDRIRGLNAGADDYLLKPFAAAELLARIRAVLRRAQQGRLVSPEIIEVGGLRLDVQTHQAWARNAPVELTPTEFEILALLMRSAGQVVSRDAISGVLHQRDATAYERSVDVHMSHLRKKLEGQGQFVIRTVRSVGYMFVGID
jgi:two-component system response regulator CpxR